MPKESLIAGIDIGTSKVCAVVAEHGRGGRVRIVGCGTAPSRGLKKGTVVDIDETTQAVSAAVERAERTSNAKIVSCLLTISGGQIMSLNNKGIVSVNQADKTIEADDVERALEAARVINVPSTRAIIHAIPRSYTIDGQGGVKNPVGMVGYRLDVQAHLVTAQLTAIQNLSRAVSRLGLDVEGVVLEPLASAVACLTNEEKEMGVAVADIGGGTTGVAVFSEGTVMHSAVLPVGGSNITNDVAVGLHTSFATAEEVKMTFGSALGKRLAGDEIVEVPTFGQGQAQKVSRVALSEIIEARCSEILSLVKTEIANAGVDGGLPAGIVLTGGGAQLEDVVELARTVLQIPVRIGVPMSIEGLADSINAPAYAASVGLVLWNVSPSAVVATPADREMPPPRRQGPRPSRQSKTEGLKGWLRAFLP